LSVFDLDDEVVNHEFVLHITMYHRYHLYLVNLLTNLNSAVIELLLYLFRLIMKLSQIL
jgi:hypothetical protein